MATYRNRNDEETIYMPAEFKLNVSMEPIDGYHMGDVDFICIFHTGSRKVTLTKSQMIAIDGNNYVACLKSKELGKGTLTVTYQASIPDNDFDDNYRDEVVVVKTQLRIK